MKTKPKITNSYKSISKIMFMLFLLQSTFLFSKENITTNPTGGNINKGAPPKVANVSATCSNPTAKADLDVNNVRATILGASDMWWDLQNPAYEIPKGSNKFSLFAGALWIGGIDQGGQIKVAGQTYRQTGNDYWMGPLDTVNISISNTTCNAYDKHFVTTKSEVVKFLADPKSVSNTVVSTIKNWPGNGDPAMNEGQYLAPFFDFNGDGYYDPENGDYPGYNLSGNYPAIVPGYSKPICNDYLFGDKNLWWVFNDVGNVHGETSSDPIGLEIRAQAFGFNTNDEINNMTFYKYQVINRGNVTLNDTYFGQWVDPDLGNATDDYVGCDVKRGLGFVYNGDQEDDGSGGYGLNPPALGIDFFQGPLSDLNDGIDNDKDGCIDCTFLDSAGMTVNVPDELLPEQIIMSKFVYYVNTNSVPNGNPDGFADFYNYLRGIWLDNVPITYGEDGRNTSKPVCNYMFPGSTDPDLFPTEGEWTEAQASNLPGDRRFIQSAGKFTLLPGAVNYVTTGAVWARASQGGPQASIELVKFADDKAQALFDNCFKLLDGPDAPVVEIRELNKELIFSLLHTDTNTVELYDEKDPTIVGYNDSLSRFRFQGYKVYQLVDELVNVADLDNPDKARLVRQFDIKDGITKLVNYTFDQNLGGNVPALKVDGQDIGISHSFSISTDAFAAGSSTLVNNKSYYFTVVSYAYNEYKKYDPLDPNALDGQKKPYLEGRNNINTYSGIPHFPVAENGGTYLHADYGDGPFIQRMEGQGNGGMILDLTATTESEILNAADHRSYHPVYNAGHGPVDVKITDPVNVVNGSYEIKFDGVLATNHWTMLDLAPGGQAVLSIRNISQPYEQLFSSLGFSANIHKVLEPGITGAINNGFLEAEMIFKDNSNQWLTGLGDQEGNTPVNWIRSGTNTTVPPTDYAGLDDGQVYENIIGGTWAPYRLTSLDPTGPKWNGAGIDAVNKITNTSSIDLVITADKSKWSRAAVIETDDSGIGIGQAKKVDLRKSPSVDKNGIASFPSTDNDDFAEGMGWFPGYAINLETGERLNIAFGENSALSEQNGTDMIWNPTANIADASNNAVFGGMHYIYIMAHNADGNSDCPLYDACNFMHTFLDSSVGPPVNNTLKRNAWKDAMWVNIPLTVASKVSPKSGEMFVPPADVRIRLRVAKDYKPYIKAIKQNEPLIAGQQYQINTGSVIYDGTTYTAGQIFTATSANNFTGTGTVVTPPPLNNFNPWYTFKTDNLAAIKNNTEAKHDALAMINVVPNPYYAISGYEGTVGITGQIDTRVRITNLPAACKISIFTTNGTLIRKFDRAVAADNSKGGVGIAGNSNTSQDWDLKNQRGIFVGSGIYLIHVEVPGVGERVIKWFGVIRPVDLDTF